MSYNFYLGKMTKKKYDKIKSYTVAQLQDMVSEEDYIPTGDVVDEFYELGGEVNTTALNPFLKPIFTKKQTHLEMSTGENVFMILTKEGLEKLIAVYHELNVNYFKELEQKIEKLIEGKLEPYEVMRLQDNFKSKTKEWTDKEKYNYLPYNLKDPKKLINSWKYEYAIFELVFIYKNFDFEKNILTLSGH